jgi:hypothetical protein
MHCDVVPATLGAWKNPGHVFCFKELDYGRFLPVIDSYTAGQPTWLRYLLVNEMAREVNLLRTEEALEHRGEEKKVKMSVGFKVRRETKRIIRQCQSLFKNDNSL